MEKSEVNANILKNEIRKKKMRIQILNYKIDNEFNEYALVDLFKELNNETKLLKEYNIKLNEQINSDKREKAYYRKSLDNVKKSLLEFNKVTKNNDKLKKHTKDIVNVIMIMEKYLETPIFK